MKKSQLTPRTPRQFSGPQNFLEESQKQFSGSQDSEKEMPRLRTCKMFEAPHQTSRPPRFRPRWEDRTGQERTALCSYLGSSLYIDPASFLEPQLVADMETSSIPPPNQAIVPFNGPKTRQTAKQQRIERSEKNIFNAR